jgi:hypothetical protein
MHQSPTASSSDPKAAKASGFREAAIVAGIAALIAGFVLLLGFYAVNSGIEAIGGIFLISVFLPAIEICQHLGFGRFSIMGGSTIPDWVILTVGVLWVYLVSLIAVIAARFLWSCFRRVMAAKSYRFQKRVSRRASGTRKTNVPAA